MQTQLIQIIEEMQHRAKTCETAAQDAVQEALTGESSGRDKHTQHASEWMIKAKFWQEAEAVVRDFLPPPLPECGSLRESPMAPHGQGA